jgi:predicted P-loop ATPase
MAKLISLPVPLEQDTEAHARADSERKRRLFEWADTVLKQLGLDRAVARVSSIAALRRITLDADGAEVILAIRDALHPASGQRQEYFRGLREGGLKQILKNRFAELKRNREAELRRRKRTDWTDQLKLDKEGRIIGNLANLILILCESPDWKGVLAFDEFNVRVVAQKPLPLEEGISGGAWTDHHDALTRVWFLRQEIKVNAGDVGRAVQAAARFNPFNPVRDFFESLMWDGVPRLDTWLQVYLHAEDGAYARAIGPRYLISAVARINRPGCKVDHVLVLEGPQGKLKSELLRTLAIRDEWFTDRLSNLSSKDAALDVAGVLLIEIAEMDAILKSQASSIKAFLSRRRDRFRPPYGRHINPPAGGYLTDPTGARRFWPVTCEGTIDRDGLEMARDQLWAEAVCRFKAGAPWWLETSDLEALAAVEQEQRFVRDDWEAPIREWIGERLNVSLWEVLEDALGFTAPRDCSQTVQKRVVKILTHLGFNQRRPRTSAGRSYRYQRDPPKRSPALDGGPR